MDGRLLAWISTEHYLPKIRAGRRRDGRLF